MKCEFPAMISFGPGQTSYDLLECQFTCNTQRTWYSPVYLLPGPWHWRDMWEGHVLLSQLQGLLFVGGFKQVKPSRPTRCFSDYTTKGDWAFWYPEPYFLTQASDLDRSPTISCEVPVPVNSISVAKEDGTVPGSIAAQHDNRTALQHRPSWKAGDINISITFNCRDRYRTKVKANRQQESVKKEREARKD